MKIKFLLLGTSLSLIPQLTSAQCVATQDCETLGYTETSCNGGKGVKCPFGNKWACIGITAEQCSELGFIYTCSETGEIGVGKDCNGKYHECICDTSYKYSCSGTGYAGGTGAACGGKYAQCNCIAGYEWKDGSCQTMNGPQSELYYCNGVVVGVKASNMDFYVAMRDLGQMYESEARSKCAQYVFCGNLKGILPNKNQLLTVYNNKSRINSLLTTYGGIKLTESTYWTSSSSGYGGAYLLQMYNGKLTYHYITSSDDGSDYARPILTSW